MPFILNLIRQQLEGDLRRLKKLLEEQSIAVTTHRAPPTSLADGALTTRLRDCQTIHYRAPLLFKVIWPLASTGVH